jgi:hypothetical protein
VIFSQPVRLGYVILALWAERNMDSIDRQKAVEI